MAKNLLSSSVISPNPTNKDLSDLSASGRAFIGVKGYDSSLSYSLNEVVLTTSSSQVLFYKSLADNNTSPLTDATKWEEVPLGGSSSNQILDIGQALFIDESRNLRRWLNGQLVAYSVSPAFITALKKLQTLVPSLFVTEENWQAEKTQSKLGQCGKFVLDDTAQTVRLPAVVNAQGLLGLSGIGTLVNESLPNITGSVNMIRADTGTIIETGALKMIRKTGGATAGGTTINAGTISLDASLSSPTYQDNASVQPEAIQYPFYIQIASGVEETLPAIREYKVNNSDYFGKSMYSDIAPNNASWLASKGQWNARSVYPDYYDWLLEQMNVGVDGFKGTVGYAWKSQTDDIRFWTAIRDPNVGNAVYGGVGIPFAGTVTAINSDGTLSFYEVSTGITYENLVYTESENINIEGTAFANLKFANDYDFVVNTADQTFRLPLLNGQEGIFADGVKGNGMTLGISNGTDSFGFSVSAPQSASNNRSYSVANSLGVLGADAVINTTAPYPKYYGVTTDPTKSGMIVDKTVPSGWNLYYYIGDTVQDASLINAGAVLGQLASVNASSRGYVVESYHNGTEWYRIHSDGWIEQGGRFYNKADAANTISFLKPFKNTDYSLLINHGVSGGYPSAIQGRHGDEAWGYTTTSFQAQTHPGEGLYWIVWSACGY